MTELDYDESKVHIRITEVSMLLHMSNKPSKELTYSFFFCFSNGLKWETEGFIMVSQESIFKALVYRGSVMRLMAYEINAEHAIELQSAVYNQKVRLY